MNIVIAIIYHWIGGLAAASFYLPYYAVRRWSWETYWLVGGVFSWIIAPWLLAWIFIPNLPHVLASASASTLGWTYFWGVMWGFGGLTYGLTMRYLGIGLGTAVVLGYCAAFGTLMPPLFDGSLWGMFTHLSGGVILIGVALCMAGIAVTGAAGHGKDKELSQEQKQKAVEEFRFVKGILVATVSGVLSSCFAYGFDAAKPLNALAAHALVLAGDHKLWAGLPTLIVIMAGGFTTNAIWCLTLNLKNRSLHEYLAGDRLEPQPKADRAQRIDPDQQPEEADLAVAMYGSGAASAVATSPDQQAEPVRVRVPRLMNYALCAAAGATWYFQFFFYTMGASKMGDKYAFSNWTLHMASIIIFASIWGLLLKEWVGSSRRTRIILAAGIAVLVLSTIIVGVGNWMGTLTP